MNCVFWNCAHGATAKIDLIKHHVQLIEPDLMFVSEAEIKTDRDYNCLNVEGYTIEVSKTISFGMARSMVFVKNGTKFKRMPELEDGMSEMIVMSNARELVCGIYRPFKTVADLTKKAAFEKLLKSLSDVISKNSNCEITIGGDWNVNWMSNSKMRNDLEAWAESFGLIQGVNSTTRHQVVTSIAGTTKLQSSSIDLVFQSVPKKIEILPSVGSDHCLLKVCLGQKATSDRKTEKLVTLDWRKYSGPVAGLEIVKLLSTYPVDLSQHPQRILDDVSSLLVTLCNNYVPKRVVRLRGPHQFENSRIEAIKKKRDRAWKSFKKTSSEHYFLKAKNLTKKLKEIIKKERKRVFRVKLESHGAKSFWHTVGGVFGSKEIKGSIKLTRNETVVEDPTTISQMFADFFKKKIDDLMERSTVAESQSPPETTDVWVPLSEEEVEVALNKCKNKKSFGHDEIPMLVVKHCGAHLKGILTVLFNKCISNGWFPDDWKVAKITPIHKKGNRTDVSNYRPISNLCALSKVFERCILERIEKVCPDDDAQHGFRGGHSTVTAALEVQHHVATALDQKKYTAIYSIDMSAAFDLLRPGVLDGIFARLGMSQKLRNIVASFLRNRRAFVSLEGASSQIFNIPTGVPQGSVLGPKLFSIYTGGLSDVINSNQSNITVYADDSYVVCVGDTVEELKTCLESTLKKHCDWLKKLGMIVNTSKTELMMFGKQDVALSIKSENDVLVSTNEMNVLGMTFDAGLTWEPQLSRVLKSCQRFKPALRMLRRKLKMKEFLQVVTSHYYSKLYYGSEVWYPPLTSKLKKRLLTVHFNPLRLATRDFKRVLSYCSISNRTKRAFPEEIVAFKIARQLYSIVFNTAPYSLFNEVLSHAVVESRRAFNPSFLDMSRTRIGNQSFANRINSIAKRMSFPWLNYPMSPHMLRLNLKKSFFKYFND
jgi:hypothetical protein